MQKIINITNKYIILATPLILYSLFSTIYLSISASGNKFIGLLFAILLFSIMTGAFIAGWGNMIKVAVTCPEKEEPNSLLKEFPTGVGAYILSSMGALIVFLLIMIIGFISAYHIGMHFIGDPNIAPESLVGAFQNTNTLKVFLSSLTNEQLIKISNWNTLILINITLSYLLVMLYIPAIFFKDKNPLKAFIISLKNLFSKHIFKTLAMFFSIMFLNLIFSVLATLFASNIILHFIITLLNFYFITLVGVGIFYYYYQTFVKPQIGQNIDLKI